MLKSKYIFFTISVFFIIVSSVVKANTANDLRRAEKLLISQNYKKSFNLYQRIATEDKEPIAQFSLALFYDYGWGRVKDIKKACHWYKKASQHDIPAAANAYADCLVKGSLGSVNYAKAALWYEKAGKLGIHFSYCHLGDLFINGQGVEKNIKKGLSLCEGAANKGSIPAMLHIGEYYLSHDTKTSHQSAFHWFTTAASYRSAKAEYYLGQMTRDGLANPQDNYTALYWFERAASKGYKQAYFPTATHYFHAPKDPETGFLSATNLAKAYLWLSASKKTVLTEAQKDLAQSMLNEVLTVMPKSWITDLNEKVNIHLDKFPPL